MRTELKREHYALESEGINWWFASRQHCIINLLSRIPREARILEIGCAGGNIIVALQKNGFTQVYGIDIDPDAIATCKKQGLFNVNAQAGEATTFPNNAFDILIASDVLEHIENDRQALAEWMRILKPGGRLILFVPAFPFLWSAHDAASHHIRRYKKQMLHELVRQEGFIIAKHSYWNASLFFPVLLIRLLGRVVPQSLKFSPRPAQAPPFINGIFKCIVKGENHLLTRGFRYPIGLSLFVLAKKPAASPLP